MLSLQKATNHGATLIAAGSYEEAIAVLQVALEPRRFEVVSVASELSNNTVQLVHLPDAKDPNALAWPVLVLFAFDNIDSADESLIQAAALYNLGLAYHRQTPQRDQAEECYQQAYRIVYAAGGSATPLSLAICQNLLHLAIQSHDEEACDFWSHEFTQHQVRLPEATKGCSVPFMYTFAAPSA